MNECLICGKLFKPTNKNGQPCCSGKCLKVFKKSWKQSRKENVA